MIRPEAQALIDGSAAIGLLAYVLAVLVRQPWGPLTPCVVFLFGLLSAFYGLRAAMGWTGLEYLAAWIFSALALTPLATLLLAEGLLRRHAPRPMKILIGLASVVSLAFAVFTREHLAFDPRLGLAAPIVLSLLAVLILLATRDRGSLSTSENAAVRSLAIGLGCAIPLIVTDFPELVAAPVGLSPLAALLVVRLAASTAAADSRDQWIEVGVIIVSAFALTAGLVHTLSIGFTGDQVRLWAVVLTGLIAVSLLVRIQPFGAAARRSSLRLRLTTADTGSLERFLGDMADEPVLKGMTVLGESALADYRIEVLADAFARRPLWSATSLQAGNPDIPDTAREPLLELLDRTNGTHVGLLSLIPVRLGVVALPELLRSADVEADLALAFRMARLTAETTR